MQRYEVFTKVGEGTFGEVFKARNRDTGQLVALKKIKIRHLNNGLPKTVLRELQGLEISESPNVIRQFEYFPHGSSVVLVLEYMETDLFELLSVFSQKQLKLPLACVHYIGRSLARALRFMHAQGLLHRDVKPSNVLVSPSGHVQLGDQGLARVARGQEGMFSHEVATRWYKAPELLLGGKCYNDKVDSWSFGCLLVETVCGKPMFAGDSDLDQQFKIFYVCGSPIIATKVDDKLVLTCNSSLYLPEQLSDEQVLACTELQDAQNNMSPVHATSFQVYRRIWDKCKLLPDYKKVVFPSYDGKDFAKLFPELPPALVDLLQRLFVLNPEHRLSMSEILAHPFFNIHFALQRDQGEAPRDVWEWWDQEVEGKEPSSSTADVDSENSEDSEEDGVEDSVTDTAVTQKPKNKKNRMAKTKKKIPTNLKKAPVKRKSGKKKDAEEEPWRTAEVDPLEVDSSYGGRGMQVAGPLRCNSNNNNCDAKFWKLMRLVTAVVLASRSEALHAESQKTSNSETVMDLQSYRFRIQQLQDPTPAKDISLQPVLGDDDDDDENDLMNEIMNGSELDSTIKSVEWKDHNQNTIVFNDDANDVIDDIAGLYDDNHGILIHDYDLLLGSNYELWESWMNHEAVDYDDFSVIEDELHHFRTIHEEDEIAQ